MAGFSILTAAEKLSQMDLIVVLLGLGTVFVGLIAIILICVLLGFLFSIKKKPEQQPAAQPQPIAASVTEDIPNRQQFIAAVSTAIAEDMGTDVSAIRIISVKKL